MASKPSSSWSPPRKRARARLVAPDQGNDGYILPTNELQEVLLKLPSKCLGRLRAVCQSWRYMLSDPFFVAAHASRSNADSILVVADHSPDRELVDLIFLDVATGAVLERMDGLARRRGELLCFGGPGPGGGAVQVLGPATDDTTDVVATSTEPYDRASFTASFYLVGHVPATAGEHKVLHVTDVRGEQSCEVFSVGAGRGQSHQRWDAVCRILLFSCKQKPSLRVRDLSVRCSDGMHGSVRPDHLETSYGFKSRTLSDGFCLQKKSRIRHTPSPYVSLYVYAPVYCFSFPFASFPCLNSSLKNSVLAAEGEPSDET
ncbi:hypothetical protein QYE76_042965 [Lolium multiflorum]|uniref:F-box domain-containing protein n=1 Tax=Lolium multiflorum TaxID=4521 RepID=A0AAD8TI46_LOLMU|nr:hypothetical protein QYE76_042965 [Lolium multiflorum]